MMLSTVKNPFDLFDEMFGYRPSSSSSKGAEISPWSSSRFMQPMKTDITENDDNYELTMDLPGYDKSEISAEVKDGSLVISAEKKEETEEKDKNYIHKERFYGKCSRSFYVGNNINTDDIKANYSNGTLKLFVPKAQEPEKKMITVE